MFLKRFLTWWYHRKIRKNEVQLENLKKQKAKILDEVMETETYKVAKEILDEFASDSEKRALNVRFCRVLVLSKAESCSQNCKFLTFKDQIVLPVNIGT